MVIMQQMYDNFAIDGVIYQLSDISSHNQLSIEQRQYVFKQTHLFAWNIPY